MVEEIGVGVVELGKLAPEIIRWVKSIGEDFFPECYTWRMKRGIFRPRILFVHKYRDYIDIWEVEWGKTARVIHKGRYPLKTK